MNRGGKFFINAMILTATTTAMRCLAVLFQSWLATRIGTAGVGIYQLIMTVYMLAVTVASAGVRLTATRLVVAAGCHQGKRGVGTAMRACCLYAVFCGTASAVLLWTTANSVAEKFLSAPDALICLKILTASLPFLSLSAALSGYFTAMRSTLPNSAVALGEQLFKMRAAICAVAALNPATAYEACAIIVVGLVAGDVVSLFVLGAIYFSYMKNFTADGAHCESALLKALAIALPDAAGSIVRAVLITVEQLITPVGLRASGASAAVSLATYRVITGMAMPVVTLPSVLLLSVSSLIVPEVAESHGLHKKRNTQHIIRRMTGLTFAFSLIAATALWLFADELSFMIYRADEVGRYIQIFTPLVPVMYLDFIVDGFLKGLGQQVRSMQYNILTAVIDVIGLWLLLPKTGVFVYIFITYLTRTLNFILSMKRAWKVGVYPSK